MLKKSYHKKLLTALCAVFCVICAGNLYAQNDEVYYDPSDYQQWKDNYKATPVEEMAFRKNKKGCAQKMAFMMIIVQKYRKGEEVKELVESPIIGPYIKEQYNKIQEKGLAQAQKEMMQDYQECINTAQSAEDPGHEYDLDVRYGACGELSKILMGTIEGIKNRQSIDTIISRYERSFPDLSETTYKTMENPVVTLIAELYKKAKKLEGSSEEDKYNLLYKQASGFVVACTI